METQSLKACGMRAPTWPSYFALAIRIASIFSIMLKRTGGRWPPCLKLSRFVIYFEGFKGTK
jgi:hypothetical protein